jgi:uncharacterized protein (DUF1501 family)
MLTLSSNDYTSDCEGYSRRDLLRVGALGLGGLTLPGLLAARNAVAAEGGYVNDKSVVFLFLRGGPTQFETWDPKMTAPEQYRAMHGEVKTSLPGVTFGSHFPKLAAMADQLSVVRSFQVGTGSHGAGRTLITSGGNSAKAAMGSVYARFAGSTSRKTGMPTNAIITPRSVGPQYANLRNDANEVLATGTLSSEFKAFNPGAGSSGTAQGKKGKRGKNVKATGLLADMQLRVPSSRLDDRSNLLKQLNGLRRGLDNEGAVQGFGKFRQQALDVITGGITDAFDLSKEDPRLVRQYDTAEFDVPASVLRKGTKNAKKTPAFAPVALGKQMLMARRLCEAGCGFVTVTSSGWDMHGNAFGIDDGMPCLGPAVDRAVSSFLTDLKNRGMSEKVLLVISGEMGRTPKINGKGGRDHWARLCPLALAGGGLKMGQVVGASDRQGGTPATQPYGVKNLLATIMHTLFDIGTLRTARGVPSDLAKLITETPPIKELVG